KEGRCQEGAGEESARKEGSEEGGCEEGAGQEGRCQEGGEEGSGEESRCQESARQERSEEGRQEGREEVSLSLRPPGTPGVARTPYATQQTKQSQDHDRQ